MTLRQHFDDRIDSIRSNLVRMGGLVNEMTRGAVDAIVHGDLELAAKVIAMDDELDALESKVLNETVLTVMQEAPVARDLRVLAGVLGVVGEVEKAGDDAVKLARRATKLSGHFPPEMKKALSDLGEEARHAFAHSIRLISEFDAQLAGQVIHADKAIDGSYVAARDRVIAIIQANPSETEHLVRSIEAFHALEHIADHAVAIAGRLRMHYGDLHA